MLRLIVFRHAKAEPHDDAHDKERRLIDRGRRDANVMGGILRDRGYLPDLVLCSSARRTVETWEHAAPALNARAEVRYLDELYDASEKSILTTIRGVAESAPAVMYIGHNPGLEDLARKLVGKPRNAKQNRLIVAMEKKFPTSAVAILDFDVRAWRNIGAGEGELVDFLSPADVKSA